MGSFVLAAFFTVLALAANSGRLCLYSDGTQYQSEAENLLQGRGFATSAAYYDEHYLLCKLPAPQTLHPPGYPLLIAATAVLGTDTKTAALLVILFSYNMVPILLYQAGREKGHDRLACQLISVSWYGFVTIWFNILSYMSEPIFTCFTLLSVLFALKVNHSANPVWPLLAGCSAAYAILIRYAGVFLLASFLVCFAVRQVQLRDRRTLRDVGLVGLPPSLVVLGLFLRNWAISHSIRGGNSDQLNQPFLSVAMVFYHAFSDLFGFDLAGLKSGRIGEVLSVIFFLLCVAWILGSLAAPGDGADRQGQRPLLNPVLSLPWLYSVISLGALGYLEMRSPIELSARMLIPLVPFLLLAVLDLATWIPKTKRWSRTIGRAFVALGAVVFALGQVNAYVAADRAHVVYLWTARTIRQALEEHMGGEQLGRFLAERTSFDHPVFANRAQVLHPILRCPVLGLPPEAYSPKQWDEKAVKQLLGCFGVDYIICFPALLGTTRQDAFFRQLVEKSPPPWLDLIHKASDVRVYRFERRGAG
ncbi:MAG: glycosyltransferase family 39 protein [Isosphaeraceae bacterium]